MSRLRLQRPSFWTNYHTTLPPSSFSLGTKTPALTVQASFYSSTFASATVLSLLCLPSSQPLHNIVSAPPTLACSDLLSFQPRAPPPPISQTRASISSETPLPHLPCRLPLNKTFTHLLRFSAYPAAASIPHVCLNLRATILRRSLVSPASVGWVRCPGVK